MKSRRGVYYDLSKSDIRWGYREIELFFSSIRRLDRFVESRSNTIAELNMSLSKRFGCTINVDKLAILIAYKRAETRGFYVRLNGEVYTCLDQITLDGLSPILRSSRV